MNCFELRSSFDLYDCLGFGYSIFFFFFFSDEDRCFLCACQQKWPADFLFVLQWCLSLFVISPWMLFWLCKNLLL